MTKRRRNYKHQKALHRLLVVGYQMEVQSLELLLRKEENEVRHIN